ncbi:MAG: bifunctional folylpolyglutamate synthase/dihydrofolate synthase, partial [Schleiferiaceae bacterium]|nr:bifunctional folylpolyglutamate synthase/dihydrofolate synthase [Schleiferiaceae bacterium]
MTYPETLEWLFAQLPMFQRDGKSAYKADLSNTLKLCELLEHPENRFRTIHVAGTNGKGSTSHMLASVFQEAGFKTGLYTSPHLVDFRERIRINGEMVSETFVLDFVAKHKQDFQQIGLSFFEMTVGMAFQYFADEQVDIAIIETGMGGRLDSTNVISPLLSIITNIGLDHATYLGDTLVKIAGEKAGIIKAEVPVVIGEASTPDVAAVFKEKAVSVAAPIYFVDHSDYSPIRQASLPGAFQLKNERCVRLALQVLATTWSLAPTTIDAGIAKTFSNTKLRGRWEVLQQQPLVICDTGHNGHALQITMPQLQHQKTGNLHLVWGVVNDKDLHEIWPLLPKEATYYFCKPNIPRGLDAE